MSRKLIFIIVLSFISSGCVSDYKKNAFKECMWRMENHFARKYAEDYYASVENDYCKCNVSKIRRGQTFEDIPPSHILECAYKYFEW